MTTVIPFLPSNLFRPKFVATFDGTSYNVEVTWNISAQRYYINIYDLTGNWILTTPLVTTPPSRPIASVVYNNLRNVVTVQMTDPSQWPVPLSPEGLLTPPGTMIDYTLDNFVPAVLNATWRSMQVTPTTFEFPLATDPGQVTVIGFVSRKLNMISGVFTTSTFIYRNGAFEVNP